jgi:hypothetical protein
MMDLTIEELDRFCTEHARRLSFDLHAISFLKLFAPLLFKK